MGNEQVQEAQSTIETQELQISTMQGVAKRLRQELALAKEAAAEKDTLQAELDRLRKQFAMVEEAEGCAGDPDVHDENSDATTAETEKLRRELRGMKLLCTTLEKKVHTYEERLLEHSKMMGEFSGSNPVSA